MMQNLSLADLFQVLIDARKIVLSLVTLSKRSEHKKRKASLFA